MKKAIYTAIINNYDTLKEPAVITSGWDYICITDNINLKSKYWQIINIVTVTNIKDARRIKIQYFEYLKGYDLSIWIDGSIEVRCNLNDFIATYLPPQKEYAVIKHNERDNIIDEAAACIYFGKADAKKAKAQMEYYMEQHYSFDNGLISSGLMIRRHNAHVKEFCRKWYSEVEQHTHRDQLSFSYVLFKHPLKLAYMPYSATLYSDTQFRLHVHNRTAPR